MRKESNFFFGLWAYSIKKKSIHPLLVHSHSSWSMFDIPSEGPEGFEITVIMNLTMKVSR